LAVVVRDGRTALAWYTWDETISHPRWYVTPGTPLEQDLLLYAADGVFADPEEHERWQIGTCRLEFTGPASAYFHWHTSEHDRGAMELTALSLCPSAMWYDPARDGEGLTLHYPDERCVGYWYTYGQQGDQRWFYLEGELRRGAYRLQIYEPKGGRFHRFDKVTMEPAGKAALHGGRLEYNLRAGIGAEGVMGLELLV